MTLPSLCTNLFKLRDYSCNQSLNLKLFSRCCAKKVIGTEKPWPCPVWGKLVHYPASFPARLPEFVLHFICICNLGLVISTSHPQNANLVVLFSWPCHFNHFWWVCHDVNLWKPTVIQWSLVLWYWWPNSTDFFICFLFFSSLLLAIPAGYYWWKMVEILWLGKHPAYLVDTFWWRGEASGKCYA